MLTLERVTYRYAGAARPSLLDVSLELRDGEVLGLVGASGAGKTTLCLVAGGLAPRALRGSLEGRLLVDGRDAAGRPMHEMAALVGSGFQDSAAQLSGICDTVFEEVAFGPANLGMPRAELLTGVRDSLERLGIADLAGRDPRRLSGGQQQLVAICGLLAMRSRHLVLDEPTAQLDPLGTRMVMDALAQLAREGRSILVAEHRTDELARICDRVAVVDGGRLVADGPAHRVLEDPGLRDLGVAEPARARLARVLAEAGIDPRSDPGLAHALATA